MWIEVKNLYTRVTKTTDAERQWLAEYLSFEDASKRFIKGYKGDGKIHLLNAMTLSFPSGFAQMVKEAAAKENIQVEIVDLRKRTTVADLQADTAWLRDYQADAVNAVLQHARGILWMPTGSGKTEVFAALTRVLPCRWLLLVHRTTLVEQAAERVTRRTGLRVGVIGEGRWEGWDQSDGVVCATFQSVAAALKKRDPRAADLLDGAEGLAVDEAHTLPADSFYGIAMHTPNAYWRIGLSGTPLARGDRRSVLAVGALSKVIYRLKPEVLIARGVLAKPKVRMVPVRQDSTKPTWQGVYGELIVRSTLRNRTVVEMVKRAAKPCIVFVKEIKHGQKLDEMLCKAGVQSSFVYGSHSTDWRTSHVERLKQGHFDVLVASVIFQEGLDIPSLRSVVIATGGKSNIAAIQRVGRGMRVEAGKTDFEVWDVLDQLNKMAERHAKQRIRAYAAEGYETVIEPLNVPAQPATSPPTEPTSTT